MKHNVCAQLTHTHSLAPDTTQRTHNKSPFIACYTNTYLLHFTLVQTHSCDDKSYHVSSTVNFPLLTIQEGKNNTNKRDMYLRTMNNIQRWEGEPHGTLGGCLCMYSIVMDNA